MRLYWKSRSDTEIAQSPSTIMPRSTKKCRKLPTRLLVGIFLLLGFLLPESALAANCSGNPNNLTNGQVADATQVMANFNNLLNCANNNLAHNGANSDITSVSGLTTPLSVQQGGTGLSGISANQVPIGSGTNVFTSVTIPNCADTTGQHLNYNNTTQVFSCGTSAQIEVAHLQKFTASGTFTIPSNATTATTFEFIVSGCGGGGGGASTNAGAAGAGGGAGAVVDALISGFNPGDTVTVTICSGSGTGGAAGAAGSNGGSSSLTYSASQIAWAYGGAGGQGGTSASVPTLPGGVSTAGTGGTLPTVSYSAGASSGTAGISNSTQPISGSGGSSVTGVGGYGSNTAGSCGAGINGGGGGGGVRVGTTNSPGCDGGSGIVIVKWVL